MSALTAMDNSERHSRKNMDAAALNGEKGILLHFFPNPPLTTRIPQSSAYHTISDFPDLYFRSLYSSGVTP